MLPLFFIPNGFHEILHAGVFFKVSEQFQQKKADGVIGKSGEAVLMRNDGPYKRKIDQGGNKPGKPARDPAIWMNLDTARPVGIFWQPENLRFWKGTVEFIANMHTNAIEFFDYTTDSEWR